MRRHGTWNKQNFLRRKYFLDLKGHTQMSRVRRIETAPQKGDKGKGGNHATHASSIAYIVTIRQSGGTVRRQEADSFCFLVQRRDRAALGIGCFMLCAFDFFGVWD